MRTQVESAKLARHVVRIHTTHGKIRGTGFFAAPGWVLTCAHVVKDLQDVVLVPAGGGGSLLAMVVARSQEPPRGWMSALWPFPDLALLSYSGGLDWHCVLLEATLPGQNVDCHAWGYPRREERVDPVGDPASFRFIGESGDGYLSLKADVVRPGISGAPLVCPDRRAVVAVMSGTRDPRMAVGGWATPISALVTGGPGVPEQLLEAGSEVLALNRATVLADRSSWQAVLPVPGSDEVLRRSWGTYRKGRRADPADLLLADFGVVPYLFRDVELDATEAWCLGAEPVSVVVVPGLGGSGKTRFAVQLCQRMIERHQWVAGEVRDLARDMITLARLPLPRLLVFDYAESESPVAVRELLDRLRLHATDVAPARVVLLTRERAGVVGVSAATVAAVRAEATAAVRHILDDREDGRPATLSLDRGQREQLYRTAVREFALAWSTSTPRLEPALDGPDYAQPLGVLFEALDAVLHQDGGPGGGGWREPDDPFWGPDLGQRVLAHEEKYWRLSAPPEDRGLLRACVALATLAGARDDAEADALLRVLPSLAGDEASGRRRALVTWLAELYRGPDRVNPLRPDRLGEALVNAGLITGVGAAGLGQVLLASSDRQAARGLTVLTRCASQSQDALATVTATLAQSQINLILRAESAARGTMDRVADTSLSNSLVAIFTSPAGWALAAREPENTGYQRDVSLSLNKLGDLAVAVGDRPRAVAYLESAVAHRRSLRDHEPERLDLAEELGTSLYLFATAIDPAAAGSIRAEARDALRPFDESGLLTPKGQEVLAWAVPDPDST